jgi:hypothetical protein
LVSDYCSLVPRSQNQNQKALINLRSSLRQVFLTSNFVDDTLLSRLDLSMGINLSAVVCLFLLTGIAPLVGAEATPTGSPTVSDLSTVKTDANGAPLKFVRSPKPPFPYWLEREVLATRNLKYNAIVKLTIDRGKIVSVVPSGGNELLAKHLAWAVQKTWVADPRMNGTFTLPIKFQIGNASRGSLIEPNLGSAPRAPSVPVR